MKKEPFIIFILIIIFLVSTIAYQQFYQEKDELIIEINEEVFSVGDIVNPDLRGESKMIVTLTNKSINTMCFSDCHPYYAVREEPTYEFYRYASCQENWASGCIEAGESKSFEIYDKYLSVTPGTHHLVIPVCLGCQEEGPFFADKYFQTELFVIE